ncbi:protein hunchback-like [Polistes fuscatus]|uniref:protein hunchback-like n=1 Tax=Polistes fuscatus TaxID=30207 RepID=UPI001CA7B937|nr:protein hunchback-like [Polistes fuscatus]
MLQTVPRVPVAGVRRRWGGSGRQHTTTGAAYHHHHHHHHHHLQESCPEVSSSGVLSPLPTSYRSGTPETNVVVSTPVKSNENLQLWDLDLQRGLQQAQIHQQKQQKQQQQQTNTTTITTTTIDQYNKTSTVVAPNVTTTSNIIATTNDHHPASPYQSTSEGIVTSTATTQLIPIIIYL